MRDERELNIDELSAVVGGATSMGGGGGFHPKPPFDIIKWLGSLLNTTPPK
jgi:bacteriocin-like protein